MESFCFVFEKGDSKLNYLKWVAAFAYTLAHISFYSLFRFISVGDMINILQAEIQEYDFTVDYSNKYQFKIC